jgi:hypothetical protein
MNGKIALFLLASASMVCSRALAANAPVRLTVPALKLWCVSSQPILIEDDQPGKKFGDLVFALLYQRLEKQAIASKLVSIGVPFLDSANPVEEPAQPDPKPTQPAPAKTTVKYVLTVCAGVAPDAPVPPTGVKQLDVAEKEVYAALCEVTAESACRAAIEKILRDTHGLSDAAIEGKQWRTSQPLDTTPTADSLRRGLVDYSMRPLQHGADLPLVPLTLMILSTTVP